MKLFLLATLVSVVTAPSIVGGSVVGAAFSRTGLFVGAVVGGVTGVLVSVRAAVWRRLIAPDAYRRTAIGGLIGFALACPFPVYVDTAFQFTLIGADVGRHRKPANPGSGCTRRGLRRRAFHLAPRETIVAFSATGLPRGLVLDISLVKHSRRTSSQPSDVASATGPLTRYLPGQY